VEHLISEIAHPSHRIEQKLKVQQRWLIVIFTVLCLQIVLGSMASVVLRATRGHRILDVVEAAKTDGQITTAELDRVVTLSADTFGDLESVGMTLCGSSVLVIFLLVPVWVESGEFGSCLHLRRGSSQTPATPAARDPRL
jgi:hypothetical protein